MKRIFAVRWMVATGFTVGLLAGCSKYESVQHEKVLTLYLNDPASAVYRGSFKSKVSEDVWCGEVNARNRMGGMVGFTRYVLYMPEKQYEINIDSDTQGARAFSSVFFESAENDSFAGKWSLMCKQ